VGDNLQYLLAEIQEMKAEQGEIMAGQASLIASMRAKVSTFESVQYEHKEYGNETQETRREFEKQLVEDEAQARLGGCKKMLHKAFS
jgi:hypothetical protein